VCTVYRVWHKELSVVTVIEIDTKTEVLCPFVDGFDNGAALVLP